MTAPTNSTIDSKLPDVGTTIFTVMSSLAAEHGALNLSQGFPDFDGPEALLERVRHYVSNGANQYAPMMGTHELRAAVAGKVADLYQRKLSPDDEITILSGATEALFCAISAVVRPGDEVILIDPAYDSYEPVVRLCGGSAQHVAMRRPAADQSYRIDWQAVADVVTPRTRAIVTNSPHNPTGMAFDGADLDALATLVDQHGLFVVSDEVYEHIVFDGRRHESVLRMDALYDRSFAVFSFGKTYHTTGWKIGYCVAPPALTAELRRIHQFVTYTTHTPTQLALADYLTAHPEHHRQLSAFYEAKRDRFNDGLAGSRFSLVPSTGSYFQLLNYEAVSSEDDLELARRWTTEAGLASIPLSPFFADASNVSSELRFCFAKDDATLDRATEILCQL